MDPRPSSLFPAHPKSEPDAFSGVRNMPLGMSEQPIVRNPFHADAGLTNAVDAAGTDGGVGYMREHWQRRGGGYRAINPARRRRRAVARQTYYPSPRSVVRPEVLYARPPLTARRGVVCNREQVRDCGDLLLDLLGWGVPLEYIIDSGLSLPGVIWLCAKLKLRLSWGIVIRAHDDRIPFHPRSLMPRGYHGYSYPIL